MSNLGEILSAKKADFKAIIISVTLINMWTSVGGSRVPEQTKKENLDTDSMEKSLVFA